MSAPRRRRPRLQPLYAVARERSALDRLTVAQGRSWSRLRARAAAIDALALLNEGTLEMRFRAPGGEHRVTAIGADGARPGRSGRTAVRRLETRRRTSYASGCGCSYTTAGAYPALIQALIGNSAIVRFPAAFHRGTDTKALSIYRLTPRHQRPDELLP